MVRTNDFNECMDKYAIMTESYAIYHISPNKEFYSIFGLNIVCVARILIEHYGYKGECALYKITLLGLMKDNGEVVSLSDDIVKTKVTYYRGIRDGSKGRVPLRLVAQHLSNEYNNVQLSADQIDCLNVTKNAIIHKFASIFHMSVISIKDDYDIREKLIIDKVGVI